MSNTPKFAIVGGGIGGLTLAIALQKKGLDVTVYEHAEQLRPLGAGITLAANAMKAFAEIGIDTEILRSGRVLKKLLIKDDRGNVLTETDAERFSRKLGVTNNIAIHRADFHDVLLKKISPKTLALGKACIDFENMPAGVRLFFQDGTETTADYVIACDGIHSTFRKKIVKNAEPRYAGYTCWRAVIDNIPGTVNVDETSETWGAGSRFGIVPLANNRLYWFACLNAPANDVVMKEFDPSDLHARFRKFHSPIPDIIKHTRKDQLIWGDIIDLKPLEKFAFGRIVLMGDAAHATTPNLGQGACMAIEDAVVLANCLTEDAIPQQAFQKFETRRRRRTRKIVNGSWRLGRVAQWESPLLTWARNAAVRATPARVTEKQMQFITDISFQ
jgi:2-polyprenyl-6-methoxyphenol hydroxylase-like FAD-dependent oxidoreductase